MRDRNALPCLLLVLEAMAGSLPSQAAPAEPLRVLVVTGANNHDWQWTAPEIAAVLRETGRFTVESTSTPARDLADRERLAGLHAVLLDYNGPRWGDAAERAFLAAVEAGLGVVVVHAANNAFPGWSEYERLVGLCWREGSGHGAYHPFDVHVVDHGHPITIGMADLRQHPDELYHRLVPTPGATHRVLLAAFSDPKTGGTGRFEPMATAGVHGRGRIFHTPLGHTWSNQLPTRASWFDPQFRRLLARGTEWAASGTVTLQPAPLNWLAEHERAEGFELLFDGRSLQHWRGFRAEGLPERGWKVRDAAIVHEAGGGGGDLLSIEEFADFDFRFSWRIAKGGNSGVIWHVLETAEQTYMTGPEYQVLDDEGLRPDRRHAAGALYDLVPAAPGHTRPAGQWNEGRILVHRGRVQHWLNGTMVAEGPCAGPDWEAMVQRSKFRSWPFGRSGRGHLALQDHGDEVAFRDLRIRRL